MIEWRHTEDFRDDTQWEGSERDCRHCHCTAPTPDSASPCGWFTKNFMRCNYGEDRHLMWRNPSHRHLPTRCTCGHPIEIVR